MKTVAIITTGSGIVNGDVIDSNSNYIAHSFMTTDFSVKYILTAGDNIEYLTDLIHFALRNCDVVIITGGLGPTDDDVTLEVLRNIFGLTIKFDKKSLQRLQIDNENIQRKVGNKELKMVEIPEDAIIIENEHGYAPGFILKRRLVALPGAPDEMTWMFANKVMPYLREVYDLVQRPVYYARVVGLNESDVNEMLQPVLYDKKNLNWGITSEKGTITITMVPGKKYIIESGSIYSLLQKAFGEHLLLEGCVLPEEELIQLLTGKEMTIATAESCTGGLIAKRLTDIAGASRVFRGSVIAYANSVKQELLEVSAATLDSVGAVSEETAREMAVGVRKSFKTDLAIATTGIAGPEGGSDAKPVGTVCFAFAHKNGVETLVKRLQGSRERIREQASLCAIDYMRRFARYKI